jgi:ribonuclease R
MTKTDPEYLALEAAVLQYVERPGYQPVKPRVIAKKLGLPPEQVRDLRMVIKRLVKQGKLAYGASHLVRKPAPTVPEGIVGVFRRTEEGYGFVRPKREGLEEAAPDLFIAARDTRDAATGDTVLVKLLRRRGLRGQPQGVVLEVLERATHQFVGTYFEEAGQGFVQVDGKVFAAPIAVGDPGAKGAQVGDKVVIDMLRFPAHWEAGEAVITEVLGPRGAPGVDTLTVIREFDLPEEFPEAVVNEARAVAQRFREVVPDDRRDFTGETVITIDPIDARDFDDAISLQRLENGHWLLGVHIADVSYFVPADSALDREAHHRGNSCYLPDRVLPMLPEPLSNGVASLQPGKVRYTKSALLEFTPQGVCCSTQLYHAAIRSARRFTYEEVDDFLAHRAAWRSKLAPEVYALLERMHELAMLLRRRRLARGALELTLPEVKVDFDAQGRVCGAHTVEHTESHQIIEEFMLAANEAVATRLADAGWTFLRRVHASPSPRKLKALTEFVQALGIPVRSLQDRFELQKLLCDVAQQPQRDAVNYAVLRSLPQAVYSPREEGHYALATERYCHFTSPIRRYPDVHIHRLVEALIAGRRPPSDEVTRLVALGEHCSQRERRAEAAERELTHLKLLGFLAGHIGYELDAVVTGVEPYGLFARGTQLPAEGLIHISSLADDYYDFDRATHSLVGRRPDNAFRLGDPLRVRVAHVDLDRRELDFQLVRRLTSAARALTKKQRSAQQRGAAATLADSTGLTAAAEESQPPKPGRRSRSAAADSRPERGARDRQRKPTATKKSRPSPPTPGKGASRGRKKRR